MTNEEKINEIISSCKNDSENLDFNFNEQNARFVLEWFVDWKEQEFAAEKQALIDKACEWLWKNAFNFDYINVNGEIMKYFFEDFRKAMEETK